MNNNYPYLLKANFLRIATVPLACFSTRVAFSTVRSETKDAFIATKIVEFTQLSAVRFGKLRLTLNRDGVVDLGRRSRCNLDTNMIVKHL